MTMNVHGPYVERAEAILAEGFKGVTTDGQVIPGLFSMRPTGVTAKPIKEAAQVFLASLDLDQLTRVAYPVETEEWRKWSNIHRTHMRHGVPLFEMDPMQREAAFTLMRVSLSSAGYQTARDVIRLNQVVADMTDRHEEFSGELYWFSVMGDPSDIEPWGWQVDGHHLIVNCFVLGDQVLMTPMFMGSEPVYAPEGRYPGVRVFKAEEDAGSAFMLSLDPLQQKQATVGTELPPDVLGTAFRDNLELPYAGIPFASLSPEQQAGLRDLLMVYVGRMRPGHALVKMNEVEAHLAGTYFAWIGGTGEQDVFYYRVQSPVILLEFDHQRGVALDDRTKPSRNHIHTVIRTPNGNDYGKDLLRQHLQLAHR